MEDIMKQYGPAVLATLAFGALLIILFARWGGDGSILTDIGEMNKSLVDTRQDFDADVDKVEFDAYASRRQPTAVTKTNVKEHTALTLLDCFDITDNDGYKFNPSTGKFEKDGDAQDGIVNVLSIQDSAGNEYVNDISVYDPDTGIITFPTADTYSVHLDIFDCYTVETDCTCYVAVDLLI